VSTTNNTSRCFDLHLRVRFQRMRWILVVDSEAKRCEVFVAKGFEIRSVASAWSPYASLYDGACLLPICFGFSQDWFTVTSVCLYEIRNRHARGDRNGSSTWSGPA
jgi:hypothetical protein